MIQFGQDFTELFHLFRLHDYVVVVVLFVLSEDDFFVFYHCMLGEGRGGEVVPLFTLFDSNLFWTLSLSLVL